jgi:hypothetical protein
MTYHQTNIEAIGTDHLTLNTGRIKKYRKESKNDTVVQYKRSTINIERFGDETMTLRQDKSYETK